MTKKKFKELFERAVVEPKGITTKDATVRRDYPYTAICIFWQGTMNMTTLKNMKGKPEDAAIVKEIHKYKMWALELGWLI
jgi:hypothetical protein